MLRTLPVCLLTLVGDAGGDASVAAGRIFLKIIKEI